MRGGEERYSTLVLIFCCCCAFSDFFFFFHFKQFLRHGGIFCDVRDVFRWFKHNISRKVAEWHMQKPRDFLPLFFFVRPVTELFSGARLLIKELVCFAQVDYFFL